MDVERPRESRHEEMEAIGRRKAGGVAPAPDRADKYTVLGAASRSTFADWLTPIEEHFVCHRNDIPAADADDWTVSLTGALAGTRSVAELREDYPTVAVAHTMECAGNDRGQHRPETGSVQWGCEAVATAIWTGTPVRSVLRDAGVDPDAEGLWLTAVGGDPSDGDDVFARSIPLSKAVDDCVLAYEMNGRPLPSEHGHPIRLIVPGWYGVNSVKWVDELRVMDRMVVDGSLDRPGRHDYWQQVAYRIHPAGVDPSPNETVDAVDIWDQLASGTPAHPYTFDENVMSLIGKPDGSATVVPGESVEVVGVAWAGDDAVAGVELSTDGGDTWVDAELFGPDYAGAWRLFRSDWTPDPGDYVLLSRATDDRGRRQPVRISDPDAWRAALDDDEFPWNEGGYAANPVEPNGVAVTVEASPGRE
jgi:DMSO/TMAO reductase YedYZ molybdopterin-dependent catalytic subunit